MHALQFELSIPRYLLNKTLCHLAPHHFFPRVSLLHERRVPVPSLPNAEWVRVAIEACGICGSDLNALRGHEAYSMEPYASFPAVMGHEIVGRVVACGDAVPEVPLGTRVAVENILPCAPRGMTPPCAACARGDYALCEHFACGALPPGVCLGFTRGLGGGFGKYVVAHRSQLFPLPDDVPLDAAVLIDSLASALQPVAHHRPAPGATVLVFGAGIIGLHVVQALRATGFTGQLVVVARHRFQGMLAKRFGASAIVLRNIIHYLAELTGATVRRPTLGPPVLDGGVDLVFDCIGSSHSIDTSLRITRKRGTVVVVGTAGALSRVDASPLWFKEITLTGSALCSTAEIGGLRQRTYQHVIDMLSDGRLQSEGLVTHWFPLHEYRKAFATALDKRRHQSLKVAFRV
ncbi:MAG: alcohol dehydrogenase catalytic domain-containing protein [Deltaproteobacteria bacterium]|nr:alcohol dehydrogenase catalytic domain-containing protein [Deltaproteobacteria bacterium]